MFTRNKKSSHWLLFMRLRRVKTTLHMFSVKQIVFGCTQVNVH